MFDFNSKIAQTTQNISKFMVGKSSLQLNGKRRLMSGRFHTLIWRPGDTVQNLESPGLSGRVDSTVYMCGPYLCDSSKHSTNLERVKTALIILRWLVKCQQNNTISCPEKEQKNMREKYVECPDKVE